MEWFMQIWDFLTRLHEYETWGVAGYVGRFLEWLVGG